MSYNLNGIPPPSYTKTGISEERKGLLSNFDVEDRDNGEPPRYEGEEYPEPGGRTPLWMRGIGWIVGVFVALGLGVSFLTQPSSRCGGMGATGRPTDPSGLLSNGTHEFKPTVLIVSIDGLRWVPRR